jgi:3,4-dihydroxy-2-butanone 4-phosphate synthase
MKIEKKVIFWQPKKVTPEMINFMATHGRGLFVLVNCESR